jgi:hypothetical protein
MTYPRGDIAHKTGGEELSYHPKNKKDNLQKICYTKKGGVESEFV